MIAGSYEFGECPACGTTRARTLRTGAELRAEFEDLWQFHLSRLREGVPLDHLLDRTFFTQSPPLQLVTCDACGTVYRNPRERADRVIATYARENTDPPTLRLLHAAHRQVASTQARLLTQLAGKTGTGLEVGSYVGAFLKASAEHGWAFEGIDVNEPVNAFVRSLGHTVRTGSIEDVPAGLTFDAIAFWNCFDQLPDPRVALRTAQRLRPGGILALRVPNGAFYERFAGGRFPPAWRRACLAWNNLLGFPYRSGFTPTSLQRLLEAHGFEVALFRQDTLPHLPDPWARRWARAEARIVKRLTRGRAPWFEIYARRLVSK